MQIKLFEVAQLKKKINATNNIRGNNNSNNNNNNTQ